MCVCACVCVPPKKKDLDHILFAVHEKLSHKKGGIDICCLWVIIRVVIVVVVVQIFGQVVDGAEYFHDFAIKSAVIKPR